jgi:hypothetical protein
MREIQAGEPGTILFFLRSRSMSARVIFMHKDRIAAENLGEAAMTHAYLKLVYCMAAWPDQDRCTGRTQRTVVGSIKPPRRRRGEDRGLRCRLAIRSSSAAEE